MNRNPYASYLNEADPVSVLEQTAKRLRTLTTPLGEGQIESAPAPGKWSIREIVAHLADCEIVFGFRLRQILSLSGPELQPFDQEAWSERYSAYSFQSALVVFEALRGWNADLIRATSTIDRARPAHHPEHGPLTFWTIVETMAGHDINHLQRLENTLAGISHERP